MWKNASKCIPIAIEGPDIRMNKNGLELYLAKTVCDEWFHNIKKVIGLNSKFQVDLPSSKPKESWTKLNNRI